jgi:hypothetical protein
MSSKNIDNIVDFLSAKPVKGEEKVVVKLYGYDNHYFLYAKLHYKTSNDIMHDLKILISEICAMDIENIDDRHVYETVWGTFSRWTTLREKDLFMRELFRSGIGYKESISRKDIIIEMLSHIGLVRMKYEDRELEFTDKYDCELNK